MSHFINECRHGLVVSQCRCPSKDKAVHVVGCPQTAEHDRIVDELQAQDALHDPVKPSEGLARPQASWHAPDSLILRLQGVQGDLRALDAKIDRIIDDLGAS